MAPGRETPCALSISDILFAAAIGLAALALYIATLQPDFGGPEDTPKFQFVGHVLGIPHPPGYPLYVLTSNLFVRLPIGTIAYRANLFSGVMAVLACSLAYLISRQIGSQRWPAVCAALGLATGASFWRSAVFAEVYSLAAVMAAFTITFLLAWGRQGGATRLLAAVGAFALGLGNHLTIVGVAPASMFYVFLRNRRALTVPIMVAAVVVVLLGASQYGLIILRTRQGAPYLESRANSVSELVSVVTAERFAGQRFAFGPYILLTVHIPAVASLIGQELGIVGVLLVAVGLVASVRERNTAAALLIGSAAGMLAMVVNLTGDLRGFITPVMVFLWPLAALGLDAIRQHLGSLGIARPVVITVVAVAAAAMPFSNVVANYKEADQSGNKADAQFLRSAYAQFPDRAGVIVEDYWSDMALYYFMLTGEAGPRRGIVRVGFHATEARAAAREGRRLFTFAKAATFLGAEGLRFERWAVAGPTLGEWLRELPHGSVVVGATANVAVPFDLSVIGHPRPIGRIRTFEAFAVIAGKPGAVWRRGQEAISLTVEPAALTASLPVFPRVSQPVFAGTLLASADPNHARIDLAGRTIAQVEAGLALAVFAPDGTLVRALEFAEGDPLRVPFQGAVYELKGETPCAELTTGAWSDVGPALATGSWVATLPEMGSVIIESAFAGSPGLRADSRELLGAGVTHSVGQSQNADGNGVLLTELTRTGERRPSFRLALNRPPASARARVRSGGARSSVIVCSHQPARALFPAGVDVGVLRADFESEAYFGAGWSDAARTDTGPVRHGEDGATLLLPLETGYSYRVTLDIVAIDPASIHIAVNGALVGVCVLGGNVPCEVTVPPDVLRDGVSSLTCSVSRSTSHAGRRGPLTFRGARILRRPVEMHFVRGR